MLKALLNNQSGYGRLTAGTVTLAVVAIVAASYQFYISRQPQSSIIASNRSVPVVVSVQLFPQSLPVLDKVGYLLEVENADGEVYRYPKFFHKQRDNLVYASGEVIKDGIFDLPSTISDVHSAKLSLFDDRIIQQPIIIPFLHGVIDKDRTLLTFIDTDFSESQGKYSLATPTDNNALVNERSGLWFGDVLQNETKLSLPALPQGWVYEGWAVINEQTITTGRFRQVDAPDRFDGFSSAQASGPSFPGEDFLQDPPVAVFPDLSFPVDLAGKSVMITIEPDVNGKDLVSEAPFPMTVFNADIPGLAQAGVLYDLKYTPDLFPKASLVLRFSN